MNQDVSETKTKLNRNYGYELLINTFEPGLRRFLGTHVLFANYGVEWKKHIPQGVFDQINEMKVGGEIEDSSIDGFLEETTLLNLKDILVTKDNYKLSKQFFGELSKEKFIELMDSLNTYRRKIAHSKSSFSEQDLEKLIDIVSQLCQGVASSEIRKGIDNKTYTNAHDVPKDFYEEFQCQHNLPAQDYDLEGGFVGREKDIHTIMKLTDSENDRIITITGAGGVGKSSVALRVAYSYLEDLKNPFEAILWFSAKTSRLTEKGITPIDPSISTAVQLVEKILQIVDPLTSKSYKDGAVSFESYIKYIYNLFSYRKFLLVIDNLETVLTDSALVDFIKDIPRPTQILITSRRGIGEIERRYALPDMPEKDAVKLFRIIAKERNRADLLKFSEERILQLVRKVKCYPLLIKWSIGQVCLGREVEKAFSAIFDGRGEIAQFVFNDVFSLLTVDEKLVLYSMAVFGERAIYKDILMQLSNLDEDKFEHAVSRLITSSFIFTINKDTESHLTMEFSMLELTRGFVQARFDEDPKTKNLLLTRYHDVITESIDLESARSEHFRQEFLLGISSREDRMGYHYVKTAKLQEQSGDYDGAEKNYQQATKLAPKLGYAFAEYSKFEFSRGHIHNGLDLAHRAVNASPDNFHAWFHLGRSLRKWGDIKQSVECLKKAKELDPFYVPTYNELGRAYTHLKEYEKAEAEFVSGLKEEKYPNYRHKIITLIYRTSNLQLWAKSFRFRNDQEGQIKKLQEAHKLISEAIVTPKSLPNTYDIYRHICKELGIALWLATGEKKGKPFIEESLGTFTVSGNRLNTPSESIIIESNYYLAYLSLREKEPNLEKIKSYIKKGLSVQLSNPHFHDRLLALDKKLSETKDISSLKKLEIPLEAPDRDELSVPRKVGRIRSFDSVRQFGVIESSQDTCLFFLNRFRRDISSDESRKLKGRQVTYVLRQGPKDKNQTAYDIEFVNKGSKS